MNQGSVVKIDVSRLQKAKRRGGRIESRCPACAASGGDRKGNNFTLFETGAFHCHAFPSDREHNRQILDLVGLKCDGPLDLESRRRWIEQRKREAWAEAQRGRLVAATVKSRKAIIERYRWDAVDVWEDSPQRIDCDLVESDPRHFLKTLWPNKSVIWTGATTDSGPGSEDRWKSCMDWQNAPVERLGPMTTPAIWKPGTFSRCRQYVLSRPYTVLDFDGLDGVTPKSDEELRVHLESSLAIIQWIRMGLNWELAAILHSGNKSLHAWFHSPSKDALDSLKTVGTALGLDQGLIGAPEHPCRLPGQRHEKSGKRSKVIWLEAPKG